MKMLELSADPVAGGFMTDLTFHGGNYGAFLGNQQFTTRNMTFNKCNTAIYMNWNWLWTLKSITVNNCNVGIDMTSGGSSGGNQSVGSIVLIDSTMTATQTGILTVFGSNSIPPTGGTLIIDHVDFTGTNTAVAGLSGTQILAGGSVIDSWAQGNAYRPASSMRKIKRVPQVSSASADTCSSTQVPAISACSGLSNMSSSTTSSSVPAMTLATNASSTCTSSATPVSSSRIQQQLTAPTKPSSLLDSSKRIFERSKPQYEDVPASSFVSVKSMGAKGDGVTDDTAAIQAVFNNVAQDKVVYFDHGAYVITETVNIPKNVRITGEIWPLIMAAGPFFSDQTNPQPVFRVGMPGDQGAVEISDLIFETLGPRPGAILMEWNVADSTQGACGLWDVHFRVGGTAGTQLQQDTCLGNSTTTTTQGIPSAQFVPDCAGSFLMLHITQQATAYVENVWLWVADHELDIATHSEVNIFNGRGMLVESQGPVWLYGTSVEHSQVCILVALVHVNVLTSPSSTTIKSQMQRIYLWARFRQKLPICNLLLMLLTEDSRLTPPIPIRTLLLAQLNRAK
jgi:glucan 1,3-beta-glucosidase